ncbi:MAG: phage holin family protein [Bifidobacteriaceae bacterium]|jgi:putative membrane protein|nr:phage holin family protein [Bifidobacteriaceae bacterium]
MTEFLTRVVVNAIALWLVDSLWDSIYVTPQGGSISQWALVYLVIGLILTLVNSIIKPVIKVLAFPLMLLSFGLFALLVNAWLLELVSRISQHTPAGLHIENFSSAIAAGLVLALLSSLIAVPLRRLARRR